MKVQFAIVLSLLAGTLVSAVKLPNIPSLHQQCNQNMVCAKGAYCRKSGDPVYGTCEDPDNTVSFKSHESTPSIDSTQSSL